MEDKRLTIPDLTTHVLLSALWGASFLFMRIAAPEFGPISLIGLRCGIGAATLVLLLLCMGQLRESSNKLGMGMLVGVLNSAIPFVLLAYAALFISSGLLSIINALVPFWSALIGWLWLRTALTGWQSVGLLVGFLGVVLLVLNGAQTTSLTGYAWFLVVGAGVLATVFYGIAANCAKKYLTNTNPLVNASNSQLGATLFLLVPTILYWPEESVSATAWWSVVALGVLCTGFAYVLFFRLIDSIGAPRAVTVVFVVPLFAVFFGATVLDETVTVAMFFAGLVIILGSALSLQLLPLKRTP